MSAVLADVNDDVGASTEIGPADALVSLCFFIEIVAEDNT
jgi:hypothetical protein